MPTVIKLIDLTLFGCPVHYIKARDHLRDMAVEEALLLEVNNGDAIDEVLNSLRKDGHLCEIVAKQTSTSIIQVTKRL